MNNHKRFHRVSVILVALLLFAHVTTGVGEALPTEPALPDAPALVEQQEEVAAPSPSENAAPALEEPAAPQANPPPEEPAQEPTDAQQTTDEGAPTPEPDDTVAPTETEEGPTPEPTQESPIEEPEPQSLTCAVEWVIDTPDGLPRVGEEITLQAEITPALGGLQLP
jgi:hypothetical protein